MKNTFPTFEEIDQGYCVYLLHDYKGLDDDGNPKYSDKLDMEVRVANNKYSELGLKVFVTRDRKWNLTGFRFEIAGNKYAYCFEYSKEGWQDCVDKIKSILDYYRTIINEVLGDQNEIGRFRYFY